MMSLPAMSLGDRFCMSVNCGTEGGGRVHPKGGKNIAVSGLGYRTSLVSTEWAISLLCVQYTNRQPCRASISSNEALFSVCCTSCSYWKLINEWVWL